MKPIAITMGDPCGIGPEIIVKAFARGLPAAALVVGDPELFAREARRLALPVRVRKIGSPAEALAGAGAAPAREGRRHGPAADLPVIAAASLPAALTAGRIDAAAGEAAYRCIVRAAELALCAEARAVVTAPINKAAMNLAGHDYPGHTELLAELAGNVPVRMMLANRELRIVLVTIHMALRDAIASLSTEAILDTIRITRDALVRAGVAAPRIAVAAVNPHAGEGAMFGREEIEVVTPAIERARSLGIDATGPHAPDTVFMRARGMREFDVVVAMYHDQGLIPVKYLGIEDGVNITIGLPFVRTSPDHGTAFDIAGRAGPQGHGLADERSLVAAFEQACAMAPAQP